MVGFRVKFQLPPSSPLTPVTAGGGGGGGYKSWNEKSYPLLSHRQGGRLGILGLNTILGSTAGQPTKGVGWGGVLGVS